MAHPVTIHPLIIVHYCRIPAQPLALAGGKFLGPYFLFLCDLAIKAVEGIRDVLKFLKCFHISYR